MIHPQFIGGRQLIREQTYQGQEKGFGRDVEAHNGARS